MLDGKKELPTDGSSSIDLRSDLSGELIHAHILVQCIHVSIGHRVRTVNLAIILTH